MSDTPITPVTAVSAITVDDLITYIRTPDDPKTKTQLATYLSVAKEYILKHTYFETLDEVDKHPDFVIVVYMLCHDMYWNRSIYVDKDSISYTVKTIMGMYQVNIA